MNIFVLIVALVSVRAEDENSEYYLDNDKEDPLDNEYYFSDNIKELVETAKLQKEDVLTITSNIFRYMPKNCQGTLKTPWRDEMIQSPTSACDLSIMDDLKKGNRRMASFNSTEFLNSFWSSETGRSVMKEIKGRGVKEDLIKAAMNDTWFQLGRFSSDCPFNRLFFAHNFKGAQSASHRNSWYTHDLDINRSGCSIKHAGRVLPVVVTRVCPGSYYESFIYPNHPFVDLALYTLCAWVEPTREIFEQGFRRYTCEVNVPGSHSIFKITIVSIIGEGFLDYAVPQE